MNLSVPCFLFPPWLSYNMNENTCFLLSPSVGSGIPKCLFGWVTCVLYMIDCALYRKVKSQLNCAIWIFWTFYSCLETSLLVTCASYIMEKTCLPFASLLLWVFSIMYEGPIPYEMFGLVQLRVFLLSNNTLPFSGSKLTGIPTLFAFLIPIWGEREVLPFACPSYQTDRWFMTCVWHDLTVRCIGRRFAGWIMRPNRAGGTAAVG